MKILVILPFLILSSCFQSSKFDTCDRDSEKLVRVDGGEKCLPKCSRDSDCEAQNSCVRGVCAPSGAILSIDSPDKKITTDVGVEDVSEDLGVVISDEEAETACSELEQQAVACAQNQCTIVAADLDRVASQIKDGLAGCTEAFKETPKFRRDVNAINMLSCETGAWKFAYCNVGQNLTCAGCDPSSKVGNTCENSEGCISGDYGGNFCFDGEEFPSGYCTSRCSDRRPDIDSNYFYPNPNQCGEGNSCIVFVDDEQRGGSCFDGCSTHSDCRPGYQCAIASVALDRICLPNTACDETSCEDDERCGIEAGPDQTEVFRCQFQCAGPSEELCNSAGGTCSDPENDKSYCVLP